MRYKRTILNVTAGLFLLICVISTIINYDTLAAGEGWGVVGMFGLASIGVIALVIDLVIQILWHYWKKR
jgi:hypothetical protein